MSDSQTVTIPAAQRAATAETRPARLLRALAQNPEPLSAPALASLLAEPGRRCRLLSSYDRALRRHEQAGHVERAGRERNGRGRPATTWRITSAGRGWLDDHDTAPARAAAAAAAVRRAAAERDRALDEARATFTRQTPRISRKRAAHQLRELGCTLDQIGAVFHVTKERIRQDLLWDPAAGRPPRKPKPRKPLSQTLSMLALAWLSVSKAQAVRKDRHRRAGPDRLHRARDPQIAGQLDPARYAPDSARVRAWSHWRRRRQYQAQLCHYRQRGYAFT